MKKQKSTMMVDLVQFLFESNMIESEPSGIALLDSVRAWEYISVEVKKLKLEDILTVHELLMGNLNPRIGGKIRECQVSIGGRLGINPASIHIALAELLQVEPKSWTEIKKWHVRFENIHPFEDGNGRSGRIIMAWQRLKVGLPRLIIHHGFEQQEYYDWFRE